MNAEGTPPESRGEREGGQCQRRTSLEATKGDAMTNKTPKEEAIQKEQERRDEEKAREQAEEDRRLE